MSAGAVSISVETAIVAVCMTAVHAFVTTCSNNLWTRQHNTELAKTTLSRPLFDPLFPDCGCIIAKVINMKEHDGNINDT